MRRFLRLAVWIIVAAGVALALSGPASRSLIKKYRGESETALAGSIRPHTYIAINSQFPGEVISLQVSSGQTVQAGDPLLTLNNLEFEMEYQRTKVRLQEVQARMSARLASPNAGDIELRAAQGAVTAAEQRLADLSLDQPEKSEQIAAIKVRDMQTLVHEHLATDAELQQAQAAEEMELRNLHAEREHLSRLKEERDVAQARLQSLRDAQSRTGNEDINLQAELREAVVAFRIASQRRDSQTIRSTISGTVLRTLVNAGDEIPSGFPLVQVGQLDLLDIDVPVSAGLVRRLKKGQKVMLRVPTEPPLNTEAAITDVMLMPAAEQSAYTVRITMRNPSVSTILVGLAAEVRFPHSEDAWRGFPF